MKFIHLSDCHLSEVLDLNYLISEEIRQIKWKSFENILKNNKDSDFALIAGDLFEKDYFSKKDYEKLFSIFKEFGKDIYYVSGNHDPLDSKVNLYLKEKPENLHLFPTDMIDFYELDNIRIYGMSYNDRIFANRFNYNLNLNSNYKNILLIHADINADNNYLNLDLERLKNMEFDYVALGHIHKSNNFGNNIIYSGSIEPASFKDTNSYGYVEVKDFKAKFIDSSLSKFMILNYDLEELEVEKLYEDIDDKLDHRFNYLKVSLNSSKEFKFNKDRLNKKERINYLDIKYSNSQKLTIDQLRKLYPNSILEEFINIINSREDNDLNRRALDIGIEALLENNDV